MKSNGGRIEVTFPGVELGVFAGRLEYDVYKGTNLIRQAVIAKTEEPSVAYKYEAGLKGLTIQPASRIVWRDTSNLWQDYRLGRAKNEKPVESFERGCAETMSAFSRFAISMISAGLPTWYIVTEQVVQRRGAEAHRGTDRYTERAELD